MVLEGVRTARSIAHRSFSLTVFPEPLQAEQVTRANPRAPPLAARVVTVMPSPSHFIHFLGFVPALPPEPLHVGHTVAFSICILGIDQNGRFMVTTATHLTLLPVYNSSNETSYGTR